MNKKFLYAAVILLASLTFGACSSDDDEKESGFYWTEQATMPFWFVDWTYNTPMPDWQAPDPSDYENWMVIMVQVEDDLKPMATPTDVMAVFVGDELRGLAHPAIPLVEDENNTNSTLYVIKMFANEPDGMMLDVKLQYYNKYLKQTFTNYAIFNYSAGEVAGIQETIMPMFTYGSQKFEQVAILDFKKLPLADAGITPAEGDQVGVFVGDDCRGTYTIGERLLADDPFISVFLHDRPEYVTVKYYSTTNNRVCTFNNINLQE